MCYDVTTMVRVGIRALKAQLSEFVHRAARGEVIVVTERGKPVAELTPHTARPLPDHLAQLVRYGELLLPSKPFVLPRQGARMRPGYSLSDVVLEERRHDRLFR